MYRYDNFDRAFVQERVAHYRAQTERYLAGQLSDDEFLQLRLRNGLYVQRLAPMLRVAVPYGTLSSAQLRMLAQIAREYDRGYAHLSTRQNVQFNWPELAEVPTFSTTSPACRCTRSRPAATASATSPPTSSPASPPTRSSIPRPYCEIMRQWSTIHPEFDWLPRKFKIAVTGARTTAPPSPCTTSACTVDDDAGEVAVRRAGRWRPGPHPGHRAAISRGLPVDAPADLRRSDHARLQPLRPARQQVQGAHQDSGARHDAPRLPRRVERVGASQGRSQHADRPRSRAWSASSHRRVSAPRRRGAARRAAPGRPEFDRWVQHNVAPHNGPGLCGRHAVHQVTGVPPGDVSDEQMDAVADWADAFSFGEMRISHEQNFVLPHVPQATLTLWQQADAQAWRRQRRPADGHDLLPGRRLLLAGQRQVDPVAEAIQRVRRLRLPARPRRARPQHLRLHERLRPPPRRPHRHSRRRQERARSSTRSRWAGTPALRHAASLGQIIGPSFARARSGRHRHDPRRVSVDRGIEDESFCSCFRRIGMEPFKERVYADAA